MKRQISIIGLGRFGKTLYRLIEDDFSTLLYDIDKRAYKGIELNQNARIAKNLKEVYSSNVIFYCVPISSFEEVIRDHKKYFKNHILIDVLSVKSHPEKIFKKYLRNTKTKAILTHPMFGPDSSKKGFSNLPLVMSNFSVSSQNYRFWKNYFREKDLRIIELTPNEHDKLAANSQGVTHFIGRLLDEFGLEKTSIDTLGAKKLQEIIEQTCNDTWELFMNLQNFNPYTKSMRLKLGRAYDRLYNKLLPKKVNPGYIIYGIQGGIGSFNEEAILCYIKLNTIRNHKIKYLYTSKKVLRQLYKGNIDYGLFAIQNSVGGVVTESIYAMSEYKFKIVEEFAIPIRHFLMKLKDAKGIKSIMAHPQVLKQCKQTLEDKYPNIKKVSGKGDLMDTAKAAQALSKGKIDKRTAILGPKSLSKIYDLEIIDENLQDDKTNHTSFLLVKR